MPTVAPPPDGTGLGQHPAEQPLSYREQLRADLAPGRLLRLGAIAAQFALIVIAIRLLNIETQAFALVSTLALGGFLVNHFLPAAWRHNFFALLSIASVLMIFGWKSGAWLLGTGGLLIALCHLPVSFRVRIALVLLAAGAAAALRTQAGHGVSQYIPATIWPILGSMFMFRLIVYLYDLKHKAAPFSAGRAISYFFMLPNVCFPLFPIVDYKTLQRSAYNDDALRLYQTGVKWMLRGLVHLLLYKVVYFKVVIEPGAAVDGMGAARYMIGTYLLYLKVSGLFHMVVGLLHMYGFGLPVTHHLYLLASSFTDLWRRINIYWKNFMQKLVFNPACFWLRKRKLSETWAIAGATLAVAILTWFFHAYQWFWIRGEFPIVLVDVLFWAGLGACLTINVLLESRKSRRRSLRNRAGTVRDNALVCMKTAGTFAAIVVLWTVWCTPNPEELKFLWRALLNSGPLDLAVLLGIPLGLGILRVLVGDGKREVTSSGTGVAARRFWQQTAMTSFVVGAVLFAAAQPGALAPLSPPLASLVRDVRDAGRLNPADLKRFQRGYYEDLGDVTRFDGELWIVYGGRPRGWNESSQTRWRNDGIGLEFIPSTAEVFKGALRTINSHGMRDREYALERGPDTFRIALIGSSHDMGAGVKDGETYENLVEVRLNRELGPRTGKTFEILNFSNGGYSPTQKLAVIEQRIFRFEPQVILYVAYGQELEWMFNSVPHLVHNRLLDEFPYIRRAMDRAGMRIASGQPLPDRIVLEHSLAPFAADTLQAALEHFRDAASARGIRPALILLEVPDDGPWRARGFERVEAVARSARLPVLDMRGSFAGVRDRDSLRIAPWDWHTNPAGHRLLADRLYSLLLKEGLVPVEPSPAPQDR